MAALELGHRRRLEEAVVSSHITSSRVAYEMMQPIIGDLPHEEFWVILLSYSNKIIHKLNLSKGGLTGTVVDVRILFKAALEYQATGLILFHNHPSGKIEPSGADIKITKKIKDAALFFDIELLDHLIVTEHSYYSFADENKL